MILGSHCVENQMIHEATRDSLVCFLSILSHKSIIKGNLKIFSHFPSELFSGIPPAATATATTVDAAAAELYIFYTDRDASEKVHYATLLFGKRHHEWWRPRGRIFSDWR